MPVFDIKDRAILFVIYGIEVMANEEWDLISIVWLREESSVWKTWVPKLNEKFKCDSSSEGREAPGDFPELWAAGWSSDTLPQRHEEGYDVGEDDVAGMKALLGELREQ